MQLNCPKCSGRVFIDRGQSSFGDIELFCLVCGRRWELHRSHQSAKIFTRLEKSREVGYSGGKRNSDYVLSEWLTAQETQDSPI
jgi:hypothetical protein